MSQRELAVVAGTTQATIAAIERGNREPSMPMLLKILRGAGFDLRLHLVAHDDHDEVLAFEESQRPARDQRAWRASQRRLVAEGRRQLATG